MKNDINVSIMTFSMLMCCFSCMTKQDDVKDIVLNKYNKMQFIEDSLTIQSDTLVVSIVYNSNYYIYHSIWQEMVDSDVLVEMCKNRDLAENKSVLNVTHYLDSISEESEIYYKCFTLKNCDVVLNSIEDNLLIEYFVLNIIPIEVFILDEVFNRHLPEGYVDYKLGFIGAIDDANVSQLSEHYFTDSILLSIYDSMLLDIQVKNDPRLKSIVNFAKSVSKGVIDYEVIEPLHLYPSH